MLPVALFHSGDRLDAGLTISGIEHALHGRPERFEIVGVGVIGISPATSGMALQLDVIAGRPYQRLSPIGRPQPSQKLGKTLKRQFLYR